VGESEPMSTRVSLPVFQTVMDTFAFAFRKFPSLFILTFVAAIITEPLTFLCLQFTGTFAEFASLAQPGVFTDHFVASLLKSGPGLLIVLMGVLSFLALITVPIIRHITHGERLWLIRINSRTIPYMLSQLPVLLILAGICLFFLKTTTVFGWDLTNTPVESGTIRFLLWLPVIIALSYFGVRLSLVPVAAVASGSLNIGNGFSLSRNNGFRILLIILMVGLPILIVGLIAMDAVLQLYSTDQDLLAAAGEPDASYIFNGGPGQILELYRYIFSRPAFIAANMIVFLYLAIAAGTLLSAPAIAYCKLTKGPLTPLSRKPIAHE